MTSIVRKAWSGNQPLVVMAAASAVLAIVSAIGVFADSRILLGQPIWLKPLKFGVSFAIYGVTLAWLMANLKRGRIFAKIAAVTISIASILELAIITTQVVRGRQSHYNVSTPIDTTLWAAMGMTIVVLWLGTVIVAILLSRDGLPDKAATTSIRFGLFIMLAGLLEGFLMTEQGETGAHSVGVPDGGPGMPLTGWSTTGGDLRIGHFVGMHALQALLLFALVLPRFVDDAARRVRLVRVAAGAYAGLFVLVTWQALRGQPLIHPDAITLGAAAVLGITTILVALRQR